MDVVKNYKGDTVKNTEHDMMENIEERCSVDVCTALTKKTTFVEDHDKKDDAKYIVDLKTPKRITNQFILLNHLFNYFCQKIRDNKFDALQDKVSISPAMEKHMEVNSITDLREACVPGFE